LFVGQKKKFFSKDNNHHLFKRGTDKIKIRKKIKRKIVFLVFFLNFFNDYLFDILLAVINI